MARARGSARFSGMTADSPPLRFRPGHQLAIRTLSPLRGEARATSDSVRACAESSPRRVAQASGVAGTASDSPGSSRASSRCRRVSVWLRRSSSIAPAASRGARSRRRSRRARPRPEAGGRSSRGRRWTARSGGRRDCRCRPTRRTAARAARGRACRTSCRSGRGNARGCRWSPSVASRRSTISSVPIQPKSWAVHGREQVQARCSSATCGAPRPARDRPGSCRAEGRGRPGRRRSRRTARFGARSSAEVP